MWPVIVPSYGEVPADLCAFPIKPVCVWLAPIMCQGCIWLYLVLIMAHRGILFQLYLDS
jgi:hypothetical protein